VTRILDDDYFPCRLAAAEKGWEESLARERELRRYLAAILIQCGGQQTICWDFIEQVRGDFELKFNDVSTPFERAVRAEFVRTPETKGA
jgi:hypothetical protein